MVTWVKPFFREPTVPILLITVTWILCEEIYRVPAYALFSWEDCIMYASVSWAAGLLKAVNSLMLISLLRKERKRPNRPPAVVPPKDLWTRLSLKVPNLYPSSSFSRWNLWQQVAPGIKQKRDLPGQWRSLFRLQFRTWMHERKSHNFRISQVLNIANFSKIF